MRLLFSVFFLIFSMSIQAFTGAELHSSEYFFEKGRSYTVTWRASPAAGNCTVAVFSMFNADDLYSPAGPETFWSEIAIETFGGSAPYPDRKSFQTQYITATTPGSKRGKLHGQKHYEQELGVDIFDGNMHDFTVIWEHVNTPKATLTYQLDGETIRSVSGGDVPLLHERVNVYAGTWITGEGHNWACTSEADRQSGQTRLEYIEISEEIMPGWSMTKRLTPEFMKANWVPSNWGFTGFDGVYVPENAYVEDEILILDLKE